MSNKEKNKMDDDKNNKSIKKINEKHRVLNYKEWNEYIERMKINIVNELQDKTYMANEEENLRFIKIMKNIVNTNILNLSNIGYLFLKFLDNTYIDNYIILNCIEVISIEKYFIQSKETDEYIDSLQTLINIIPDLVIKLEFTFNLHFLILLYFLKKEKNNNVSRYINKHTSNLNTILNNLNLQLKGSTIILLLFKLIHNVANLQVYIDKSNEFIIENVIYIEQVHNKFKDNNLLLDEFIVNISNTNNTDLFVICNKYILDMAKIFFQEMRNIFNYIIEYLLKSKNNDIMKNENLKSLERTINNILDNNFDNISRVINDI